jgi:translation initiation factor 4E
MDKKRKRGIDEHKFKSGLKTVASFKTIDDFYNIWSYMKKPTELACDVNLYLFRQGLTPAWESFPGGGHWIIKITKGNGLANLLWEELVMATLGEQFATPELVGIAMSTRKHNDVLTIWNRDNQTPCLRGMRFVMGERLKTILNLHHNTTVEYKEFSAALTDKSTTKGAKQYIYVPQNN